MGNSQSSDGPHSPSPSTAASGKKPRERDVSQHRGRQSSGNPPAVHSSRPAIRNTSIPTSHQTSAQQSQHHHAPPSNLLPASSVASTSTSSTHAHATVSASPASSTHKRNRSTTTSAVPPESRDPSAAAMGQGESRPRPPSRSATLPHGTESARAKIDAPTEAIGIPGAAHEEYDPGYGSAYGLGPSDFSRPPRLPLPIETEHEPGSPIPSPTDADGPPLEADMETSLGRRASMLSSTTLDDDDAADIEAFVLESNPSQPKVPTTIQYHDAAAKGVYVTGTFVKWERKFRLHRNPNTGSFSTTFPLPTGTHHLKFLVDGDMRTSEELPTTVDFTNALVNYIEVVAQPASTQPRGPSDPMPIPGTAGTMGQPSGTADGSTRPIAIGQTSNDTTATIGNDNSVDTERQNSGGGGIHPGDRTPSHDEEPAKKPKTWLPRPTYTTAIPAFLLDIDLYNTPEDERYRRAVKASEMLPAPPSLPGFMGKSILNAATPHKDDASVLAMPNHTVINHLATSSIKNGVLATSGTTRYKRKFLTTIMYKPTSDDG